MAERLAGCRYVSVLPQGFREDALVDGPLFVNYGELPKSYLTLGQLRAAQETYEDLMVGQPGWPQGAPRRPYGIGVEWGVRRNGVEWWLTNAEGVDDSAAWQPRLEEPAVGDGSWLLDVRAPGRQVTLTGMLVGDSPRQLGQAVSEAAATLAAAPRTGWLMYDDADGTLKRLSVALAGQTKTKRVGRVAAEVQMTLQGVDIGSPGAGAYMEALGPTIYTLRSATEFIAVGGLVPTPPRIVFQGPLNAGASVDIGEYEVVTTVPLLAAQQLVVDCRLRSCLLNGTPSRSAIRLDAWPVLPTGAVVVQGIWTGAGHVTLEATPLW